MCCFNEWFFNSSRWRLSCWPRSCFWLKFLPHSGHLKGLIPINLLISWSQDICSLTDVAQERTQITKISFHCVFFDVSWAVSVLKSVVAIYLYDSLFQCEFWCALTSQLCQWKISYSEHKTLTLLPGEPSCGASMAGKWLATFVTRKTSATMYDVGMIFQTILRIKFGIALITRKSCVFIVCFHTSISIATLWKCFPALHAGERHFWFMNELL